MEIRKEDIFYIRFLSFHVLQKLEKIKINPPLSVDEQD